MADAYGNVEPIRPRRARGGGEPVVRARAGRDAGDVAAGDPGDPGSRSTLDLPVPASGPDGFEAAFASLYRRAYDVAYKLLGYRSEAEDVAQEALARAYLHWPKIHAYAEPWVVRVASNLAIGSWRKNRRLTPFGGGQGDLSADGDGRDVDQLPGRDRGAADVAQHLELRRALERLSKRQREVVVLRHLAGFSERETAAALGCATGSVKQHASRGLAALQAMLTDEEGGR